MIKSLTLFSTLFLLAFVIAPFPLKADESLRFQVPVSYKEKQIVALVKPAEESYLLAPIDLNDDALPEYVVKPASCAKGTLCSHHIIVFQDRQPIELGQFDAHKILISGKKDYGIRQIIVYNNSYNDFENSTARWNPFAFRFELP